MMLWTSSHPPAQHGLDLMDLLFWWQNNGQKWFGQDQYVDRFIRARVKTMSRMGLSSTRLGQDQNHIFLSWSWLGHHLVSVFTQSIDRFSTYYTDIFISRHWKQTHSDSCACSDTQRSTKYLMIMAVAVFCSQCFSLFSFFPLVFDPSVNSI